MDEQTLQMRAAQAAYVEKLQARLLACREEMDTLRLEMNRLKMWVTLGVEPVDGANSGANTADSK